MLMPRKPPRGYRKPHAPKRKGKATRGTRVTFGEYGIQALEHGYVTNRQIEAARIAMTRHIKRGGKVWINIFPDRAIAKKRQGLARVLGGQRQARPGHVRAVVPDRVRRQRGADEGDPQAAHEVPHRDA